MKTRWAAAFPGVCAVLACSPVPQPEASPAPPAEDVARQPATDDYSIPAGFGSLRQDDFSVELSDGAVQVKVTPLTEEVIRLAAPDTYERLNALVRSRADAVRRLVEDGRAAELFLVSFFSRESNVEYRPEELQLTHRGRTVRPVGILPLTTGWGRHLLQPQQTQSAIYVFAPTFDYSLPITTRYGLRQSDDWHRVVLPRLDDERSRVLSRAQANGRE
jgi:hypothetical protein